MAPKLVIEILGDTSNLEKSFSRAEKQTRGFTRDIERAGRGATVAAVGFRGLGRSVAFASGAFLGGAGFISVLRSSVEQATAQQRILANLRNALAASGYSWNQYGARIEDATRRTKQLSAFDDEELFQSLQLLVRGTGSVNKALQLNSLAADVARGRNLGLVQSAQLLVRVYAGQVGSLRRLGINVDKGISGTKALQQVQKQYAGAAAAYGRTAQGAQERFTIAVQDTQKAIGGQLLPILTPLLNKTTAWLNNTENQARIQKDVNALIVDAVPVMQGLGKAIEVAAKGLERYNGALDNLRQKSGGPDDNPLTGFAKVLRVLVDPGYGLGKASQLLDRLAGSADKVAASFAKIQLPPGLVGPAGTPIPTGPPTGLQGPLTPTGKGPAGVSAEQRNRIFDARIARMLDRVQDIKTLRGQISQLHEIAALIQQRINVTKDITRRLNLGDQIARINRDIVADQAAIADKDRAAADRLKAKEEKARAAEKAAQQASLKRATDRVAAINALARAQIGRIAAIGNRLVADQRAAARLASTREQERVFGLIGLTATGETRAPNQGNLQASLAKAEAAIRGGPLDSKAMRSRLASLRQVLNTEFDKLTRDTKIKVGEFLDALAGKQATSSDTGRRAANIKQLVEGTGLVGAGLRRLEFNLAGAHLTVPVTKGGRPLVVHTSVNLDGRQVARNTTEHQERDYRRRAHQTRGRLK